MIQSGNKFKLAAIVSVILASITFGYKYWIPEFLFWDENYHIASCYKYIHNVFFLEPHPPLGKLLIAFFENFYDFNSNLKTEGFLLVDHLKNVPKEFSFKALRMPGVTLAILSTLNLFLISYNITKSSFVSFCISTLFSLDNAIIVHSKSAMLESPQLFLITLAILLYVNLIKKFSWLLWILFSIVFGLALCIKLNSAILLILLILCLLPIRKNIRSNIAKLSIFLSLSLSILISSYYAHFRIAKKINTNKDYGISKDLKDKIKKQDFSIKTFKLFLIENYKFVKRYQSGVPTLQADNPGENGSHPIFWPAGKKSISYRWDKTKDGRVKHLKLQINPVGWFISFSSIVIGILIIFAKQVFAINFKDQFTIKVMQSFVFAYLAYMLTMLRITRVMYLYHYFIPLIFTFVITACIFKLLIEKNKKSMAVVSILLFAQLISFYHFSPFTYHLPVSAVEFTNMSWFNIWRNELIFW